MPDFRQQALALPGAVEMPHHGAPSFRVDGKIFAQLSQDENTALLKLSPFLQEWGVATYPDACTPEAGRWGKAGWTRLRWRDIPAKDIAEMLDFSWKSAAGRHAGEN